MDYGLFGSSFVTKVYIFSIESKDPSLDFYKFTSTTEYPNFFNNLVLNLVFRLYYNYFVSIFKRKWKFPLTYTTTLPSMRMSTMMNSIMT